MFILQLHVGEVVLEEFVDEAVAQASLHVVFADALEEHSIG
ncbi:hypothetical protein ACKFKF_06245 [Phormidesmis sp. 146-12]